MFNLLVVSHTMNLLPKNHGEFVKQEYWENFFKKRGKKAFEWYGEYPELCGVLHKYVKVKDRVLVVGCGSSELSANLYDVGYHDIINIDISDTVIQQMVEKNAKQRPDMKFMKGDVLNLEFNDSDFSVVLDKGTLDALMVDTSEKVVSDIEKMFNEIDRVLKLMGRYICISLLQEHILNKVLQIFSDKGWFLRIHRINVEESGNADKDFYMPVFALVFTKFKSNPHMPSVYEMCSMGDKNVRFSVMKELIDVVKEMQYYAVIRQKISKSKVTEDQLSLSLYSDGMATPRYTLTIVDSTTRLSNKFAIFIVPQGRETEWMFSTRVGRDQLANSAGFERLVVVCLDRNHTYHDLQAIQDELSSKVMELAPPGFKHGTKVPFLSLGEDIGKRQICSRGFSDLSGDYIIEDIEGDGGTLYRRLYFLSNPWMIQSEARLKTVSSKKKGKGKKTVIDKSYLACQHHVSMVTGLSMIQHSDFKTLLDGEMMVLLVGLGGGGLPTYIHENFPHVHLDVVDLDPVVVSIATEWFGFTPDSKMQSHIADGIKFIQEEQQKDHQYHAIILDVDSKDVTLGMSAPPPLFVENAFLLTLKQCLHTGGVLMLNLVCRDAALKKSVMDTLQSIFPFVNVHDIEDEVNDVVYAINSATDSSENSHLFKTIEENGTLMNSYLSACSGRVLSNVDFVEQIKQLQMLG